jgi:hypothetical protein
LVPVFSDKITHCTYLLIGYQSDVGDIAGDIFPEITRFPNVTQRVWRPDAGVAFQDCS